MISTEKHDENNYPALIEAILFVAEEPITILNLAKVLEIKPSQIDIGKTISKVGLYEAKINLHPEIQAKIHIEVVKEEDKN